MLEPLIDTIIVCTITAFIILMSNLWVGDLNGAALTAASFNQLWANGKILLSLIDTFLLSAPLLAGAIMAKKCAEFIFGSGVIKVYRVLWVAIIPIGATVELNLIWLIADIMNGLMSLPNLIALVLLGPIIFAKTNSSKFFIKA